MTQPDVKVEIGFGFGWRDPLPDVDWTDVTPYVLGQHGLGTARGRADEFSDIQPSRCSVTFDNRLGHFTPENAASAFYPNVVPSVPIRITLTDPDETDHQRFTGYVEGWPIAWDDGTEDDSTVTVTALASFPRLVFAQLEALMTMEQLEHDPVVLFPLNEAYGPPPDYEDPNRWFTVARDRMGLGTEVRDLSLSDYTGTDVGDEIPGDPVTPTDDDGGAFCATFSPLSNYNPVVYPATHPAEWDDPAAIFNLCANPSFEVDTSWHFAVNGVLATSATQAWTGTRSLRVTASSAGTVIVRACYAGNNMAEVTPGVPVYAKVRVRAGSTARSVKLEAIIRKSDEERRKYDLGSNGAPGIYDEVVLGTVTNDSNSAWTTYEVEFTPGTDCYYFALQLTITGCANGEIHYIDGEQAFAGADHAYFDGDTADCQWTGRVGASVSTTATSNFVTTADAGFSLEVCLAGAYNPQFGGLGGFFTLLGLRDIGGSPGVAQWTEQAANGLVDGFEFGFEAVDQHLAFTRRRNGTVTTVDTEIAGLIDEPDFDPETNGYPRLFHHLLLTLTRGASTSVVRVYVDGVLGYTSSAFTNIDTNWNEFFVQGWTGTGLTQESGFGSPAALVAHVGLYNHVLDATAAAELYEAAATGWVDEDTAERFGRYAEYADVEWSTEGHGLAYSFPLLMTNGRNALETLRVFQNAERGLLVEGGDGGLIFQTRSVRPENTIAVSLSFEAQEVQAGLTPTFDKFGLLNEYTVTSSYDETIPAGYTKDRASDHAYGPYPDAAALHLGDQDELQEAADLEVASRANPAFRIPSITVDVTNLDDAQTAAVLALEISDRIELTDLPAQAPASTMEFFVENIVDQVGFASHFVTLTLSPSSTQFGWVLDSATESVLDTTTIPI